MTMRLALLLGLVVVMFSMCRKHKAALQPPGEPVFTKSHTLIAEVQRINEAFGGYYIALPNSYDSVKRFPLLVFLHGLGQRGDGNSQLNYLLFDGVGKVINDDRMPLFFKVKGEEFSFIVLSPQYQKQPTEEEVIQLLDSVVKKYKVRTNRIYISGLSLGGRIATLVAAKYPKRFAAMVPIAGVATNSGMGARAKSIAEADLPFWELHNLDDPMADVNDARRFVDSLNNYVPRVPPKLTVFDKYGHDAWTTALDTAYREDGKNIYEWMLQYYR